MLLDYILTFLNSFHSWIYYGIRSRFNKKLLINKHACFNKVIICIHGVGGHVSNFSELELDDPMLYVNLGDNYNNTVEQDLDITMKFLKNTEAKEIILIGMSRGGLVAAEASLRDLRIKKVITIASPLRGTCAVNYLRPILKKNLHEMELNSDMCKRLESKIDKSKFYHVVNKYDFFVYPPENSHYDVPDDHIHVYSGKLSHIGLLYDQGIKDKIVEWIK